MLHSFLQRPIKVVVDIDFYDAAAAARASNPARQVANSKTDRFDAGRDVVDDVAEAAKGEDVQDGRLEDNIAGLVGPDEARRDGCLRLCSRAARCRRARRGGSRRGGSRAEGIRARATPGLLARMTRRGSGEPRVLVPTTLPPGR